MVNQFFLVGNYLPPFCQDFISASGSTLAKQACFAEIMTIFQKINSIDQLKFPFV